MFTELGELFPELGELFPELDEMFPELDELFPELGESFPEIGEMFPELGELFPELGELFPELGELFPELGETTETRANIVDVQLCMDFVKSLTTSGDPNENRWRHHVRSRPTGWEPMVYHIEHWGQTRVI